MHIVQSAVELSSNYHNDNNDNNDNMTTTKTNTTRTASPEKIQRQRAVYKHLYGVQMPDYIPGASWYVTRLRSVRAHFRGTPPPQRSLVHLLNQARTTTPRSWREQVARVGNLIYPAGTCVGIELEHLISTGSHPFDMLPIIGARLVHDGSVSQHHRNERGDTVTTPGAITNPNGQEAILMIRRDKPERLQSLCTYLKANGGLVNPTCGLHVHLDQRDVNRREALTRARRITAALPWLVSIVPKSRRNNAFCKLKMSIRDRYVAVNCCALDEHNTIEIRLGAGSLDADKILAWSDLLLWLSRAPKRIKTLDAFLASAAPVRLKLWVVNRHNKFAPITGTTPEGNE